MTLNKRMQNYDNDIGIRMKISDDLEMKRLKHETDEFYEDISGYEQVFQQSESLDLIEHGIENSINEELKEVCPINGSDALLSKKYKSY